MTSDRRQGLSWRRLVLRLMMIVGGASSAGAQTPGQMPVTGDHLKEMRWGNTLFLLIDELEVAPNRTGKPISLDARAWYGGAVHRVWMRAEAGQASSLETNVGDGELELLYGRLVHPFWDAVVGARIDRDWGGASEGRAHLAFGVIGLSPYRFELEPTLYVSDRGHVSARFKAEFPLLLTHRLIAEPALEVNAALQSLPRFEVRSGLNDYSLGIRLRYEIRREFAPYIGWMRTRRIGVASEGSAFVTGLRLWY